MLVASYSTWCYARLFSAEYVLSVLISQLFLSIEILAKLQKESMVIIPDFDCLIPVALNLARSANDKANPRCQIDRQSPNCVDA
jgi:hypothetical protein